MQGKTARTNEVEPELSTDPIRWIDSRQWQVEDPVPRVG